MTKTIETFELDHYNFIDFILPKTNSVWRAYCDHGKYMFNLVRIQDSLVSGARKKAYVLNDTCIINLFSNNDSFDKQIKIYIDENGELKAELLTSNFHYGKYFTINRKIVEPGNPNW
jgi:hypothetical protein